jgi:hypothetical protein
MDASVERQRIDRLDVVKIDVEGLEFRCCGGRSVQANAPKLLEVLQAAVREQPRRR